MITFLHRDVKKTVSIPGRRYTKHNDLEVETSWASLEKTKDTTVVHESEQVGP